MAASLIAALPLTTGTASATAQAPCDTVPTANSSNGYGIFVGTYNLKQAPAMECATVASVPQGSKFYFWCHTYNHYGNLWVYGRVAGTQIHGWTSMDNLNWVDGTLHECKTPA
jgi:hypothetical protein